MKQLSKRIFALGTALLLALGLCACGGASEAAGDLDTQEAVIDEAGILTQDTENYVYNLSRALDESCGAKIGVYTVEYIGNTTMEGYAYDIANRWQLGDAEKDNGILLLLAVGEDDYYVTRGAGLESALSAQTLKSLLNRELEPSWVEGDYDTGTRQTVYALAEQLCGYYGLAIDLETAAQGGSGQAAAPAAERGSGGGFLTVLLIVLAVVLIIWVIGAVGRSARRGPPPPPPPGGDGFGGYGGGYYAPRRRSGFGSGFASGLGFGMGQSVGRRMFGGGSRRQSPPPPPPGGFGGPGMGGGRSAPPRPSAPRGGGMGGAGRSAGGIGRVSGGFRHSGGSFRGGGAGRH